MRLPKAAPAPSGRTPPAIAVLTIAEIRAGYDAGAFTPSDVVAAVLGRIAALEPHINAFVTINHGMVEDARRADAELLAGSCTGSRSRSRTT